MENNQYIGVRKLIKPIPHGDLTEFTKKYNYERTLGEGGFGCVVLVKDRAGNQFAAKLSDGQNTYSSNQEIKAYQLLRDTPNVPKLHAYYSNFTMKPYTHALIIDYAKGDELADRIARITDPKERINLTYALLTQMSETVQNINKKGLVHRDIKPENIMTDGFKSTLIDLGTLTTIEASNREVQKGGLTGTLVHMAPESFDIPEEATQDQQADIYALGTTAEAVLTGKRRGNTAVKEFNKKMGEKDSVYGTNDMFEIAKERLYYDKIKRTKLNTNWIPPTLEAVVNKASAPLKENRYVSAEQLREETITSALQYHQNQKNDEWVEYFRSK